MPPRPEEIQPSTLAAVVSSPEADPSQPSTSTAHAVQPPTSTPHAAQPSAATPKKKSSSSFKVSPLDVNPLPHEEEKQAKATRNRGKTAILTSTPYKDELEQGSSKGDKSKRKLDFEEKEKQKSTKAKKAKSTAKSMKKGQKKSSLSSDEDEIEWVPSSSEDDDDDRTQDACMFCNELLLGPQYGEEWLQCAICKEWAHQKCSGYDRNEVYQCNFCICVTKEIHLLN